MQPVAQSQLIPLPRVKIFLSPPHNPGVSETLNTNFGLSGPGDGPAVGIQCYKIWIPFQKMAGEALLPTEPLLRKKRRRTRGTSSWFFFEEGMNEFFQKNGRVLAVGARTGATHLLRTGQLCCETHVDHALFQRSNGRLLLVDCVVVNVKPKIYLHVY